jgi:hypothetical protein
MVQNWDTNFQVGLLNPPGTDRNLLVHEGFYHAFEKLNDGATGLRESVAQIKAATNG